MENGNAEIEIDGDPDDVVGGLSSTGFASFSTKKFDLDRFTRLKVKARLIDFSRVRLFYTLRHENLNEPDCFAMTLVEAQNGFFELNVRRVDSTRDPAAKWRLDVLLLN